MHLSYDDIKHHNFPVFTLPLLRKNFLCVCFMSYRTPPHRCHSPVTYYSQEILRHEYLSHCFIYTPGSDMRSCCDSSEIMKFDKSLYDHNYSFKLSHTYTPDPNNFSMSTSHFCHYQKYLIHTHILNSFANLPWYTKQNSNPEFMP